MLICAADPMAIGLAVGAEAVAAPSTRPGQGGRATRARVATGLDTVTKGLPRPTRRARGRRARPAIQVEQADPIPEQHEGAEIVELSDKYSDPKPEPDDNVQLNFPSPTSANSCSPGTDPNCQLVFLPPNCRPSA